MTDTVGQSAANAGPSSASIDPLVRVMQPGQSYDLDGLAALSGLDGAQLLPRLLGLELHGLIRRIGGGRFMRSM